MSVVAAAMGVAAGVLTLPQRRYRPSRPPGGDHGPAAGGRIEVRWHFPVVVGALVVVVARGPLAVVVALVVAGLGHRQLRRWQDRAADRRMANEISTLLHDVARRLRAGYSTPLAFTEVLGQMPNTHPGAATAAMLARGEPLRAAVAVWRDNVHRRVGASILDDLHDVVALGDLLGGVRASAVEVLADLATERRALAQEVGAQASQAKASAVVMTVAPVVFSAQMVLRDPAASRLLLGTPVGWVLLAIGVALDALAWLWIRRLTGGRPMRRRPKGRSLAGAPILPALIHRAIFGQPTVQARLASPAAERGPSEKPHPLESIGATVERALAMLIVATGSASPGADSFLRASSAERRRRLGLAVVVLPPLVVLRPALGLCAMVVLSAGPHLHRRSVRRTAAKARAGEVGSVIELVRLALEGGSTPSLALIAMAQLTGPALQPSLARVGDELRRGVALDVVLRQLTEDAPELAALADVLLASSRLGLGVAETLRSLAVEARATRRRQAEAAARRLPVALLFPVVCLTLPAFVVLTVAPLLLSGLGSLHL